MSTATMDDTEALEWLAQNDNWITRTALGLGGHSGADDAAQEARWLIIEMFRKGRGSEHSDAYLRTAAKHRILSVVTNQHGMTSTEHRTPAALESSRKYRPDHIEAMAKSDERPEGGYDPESAWRDEYVHVDEEMAVEGLLGLLDDPHVREVARLKVSGLSSPEVGEELGLHPSTVKRRWTRARKVLVQHVEEPREPYPAGISWARRKKLFSITPIIKGEQVYGGYAHTLDEAITRLNEIKENAA